VRFEEVMEPHTNSTPTGALPGVAAGSDKVPKVLHASSRAEAHLEGR
jgi:hypothetical protein